MSVLQQVLTNHIPPEWSEAEYADQRYILIEIHPGEEEYDKVVSHFNGLKVTEIQRIQNPYAWGRYILRKEQLNLRTGCAPNEVTKYHPIHAEDIRMACEYNCDRRRYSSAIGYGERIPRFYGRPSDAIEGMSSSGGEKAVVVVTVLNPEESIPYITKNNDTEFYPVYIVRID